MGAQQAHTGAGRLIGLALRAATDATGDLCESALGRSVVSVEGVEGRYPYCPNCGAEYRVGFERCAECDVELTNEAPAPEVPIERTRARPSSGVIDPESDLVEVYRSSSTDAESVRSYLEGHGITAVAIGEGTVGAYTFNVGPLGERRVMVRVEDAADARGLIDQVRGPSDAGPDSEVASAFDRWGLGFPAVLLVGIAIVITVGIVVAYLPGP